MHGEPISRTQYDRCGENLRETMRDDELKHVCCGDDEQSTAACA